MKTAPVPVATRLIDTVIVLGERDCGELKAAGIDGVIRYLGSLTSSECAHILSAGLGLMPVTYAGSFNGGKSVDRLRALNWPAGGTVFLDLESTGALTSPAIIALVNAWAACVRAAGYDPGLYVGCDQKLTSDELTKLGVDKYWHSCSQVVDRNGAEAAPSCGWVLTQLYPPNQQLGAVQVDYDFAQVDYHGRSAIWVTEDAA